MNKQEQIQTIITCPNCKTKMDIKDIKNQIKQRIDAELDCILEKI